MSILKNLSRKADVENPSDVIGGSFSPLATGIYEAVVKLVYLKPAQSGALGIEVHLEVADKVHSEWLFVTNKNGENTYTDKQGAKRYLPSFTTVDELCYLVTGKHLSDMDTEDKYVKLFDYETRSEKPTEVPVISELLGQKVLVGLIHKKEFKQVKQGDKYVPSDEIRESNEINKFFNLGGQTYNEVISDSEAEFIEKWREKYTEEFVKDMTKNVTPVATGDSTEKKPTKSLFGNK